MQITSPSRAVKQGIGYLSEDRKHLGLVVDMDVKTNIVMSTINDYQTLGFVNDQNIAKVSEEYVERLKVKTPSINQQIKFLSGGISKRL